MDYRQEMERKLAAFLQQQDEFKHLVTKEALDLMECEFDDYIESESYTFHATSCRPHEIEKWNHKQLMRNSAEYRLWYSKLGTQKRRMIRDQFDGKEVLKSEWMMSLDVADAVVVSDENMI
jgi:hypothetical protein